MNRTDAIYQFIIEYKLGHDGVAPTNREIGAAVGISSTSVVDHHLSKLERQGNIERIEDKRGVRVARGIKVIGGNWTGPGE